MARIELENVRKLFPGDVAAVDGADIAVEDGEFLVLVGPSGCGKTTLLRMIAGLERVSAGRIRIGHRDVTAVPPGARDLAMVFQDYALYPHMTVRANLGYSLKVHRTPKREIARRVDDVARMLGLDELLDRLPAALSGGQQQRVAMGRAIIREPAAFLMDEPLSNLDAKLRVGMRASLQQLHARLGTTTVYVTHDQVEAMTLGQRIVVMRKGRIQQSGPPQALYSAPANLFVAAFLGSPPMNLVEATVEGGAVHFGGIRLPIDSGIVPAGARDVVLGIRPEAFDDAAFAPSDLPVIDVRVAVHEELGADSHILFEVDEQPVVVEDAATPGGDDASLFADRRALFTARIGARTAARVGEPLRLAVDPARLHFFSRETGERLATPRPSVPA